MVRRTAALILLSLVIGCRSLNPLPHLGIGTQSPEEDRIEDLMKWHSDRIEVYKGLRTVFTARGVYLSEEVQESAVEWEARSRLMTPEEKVELASRVLKRQGEGLQFLFGFYTPRDGANILEKPDSPWVVYMRYPDGRLERAACFGTGEEEMRIYNRFLDWDLSWSRLYILCFPGSWDLEVRGEGKVTLVITGPEGKGEMEFRVLPPPEEGE